MDLQEWYYSLNRPDWSPSVTTIGRVWTALYPIIFAVNIYAFILYRRGDLPLKVAVLFWINLALNFAFTPIQIAFRNNFVSLIIILLILATIIAAIIAVWPHNRWMSVAYVPYLVWVAIATALQYQLFVLNN